MQRLMLTAAALLAMATAAHAHNYLGAERCETCHTFAYQKWKRGPHAQATEDLSPAQAKDPKCSTCHSLTSLAEPTAKFEGVQCESCHGPGRFYYPNYVMRDGELARAVGLVEQGEAVCVRCHTAGAPSLDAFDYKKMWAEIDLGETARKAWEARDGATEKTDAGKSEAGEETASR